MNLCINLDDPIQHDPDWKHRDPTGCFERMLAQQISPQLLMPIQRYGLALGLFRDVGFVEWPEKYDLRADIEAELGISVEEFIGMGHFCFSFQQASNGSHKCFGTFTPWYLAEAYRCGLEICTPNVWRRFLSLVACDRDEFRRTNEKAIYKVNEPHFVQFEFNPLRRFPITEVQPSHFVSVDPYLIVERTTLGLFFDLFEKDGIKFATRFGHAFDRFVGQVLGSVCPSESLWSASRWEQKHVNEKVKEHCKIGDWAFIGSRCTVLFECKSLRPSLELTTYGADESVQKVTDRITSALEQLIEHSQSIQKCEWQAEGLLPGKMACVIVTYGRINTINGPFTRKRICQRLTEKGFDVPPFVVLSLEELDIVVRLAELGKPLDEVVLALADRDGSFNLMAHFEGDLKEGAVSSFAFEKGKEFMDRIVECDDRSGLM